jgi:hypothetical protein
MASARAKVAKSFERGSKQKNRRRHARVPVGLPVQVHLDGRADAIIVELIDLAAGGARFRALSDEARVEQRAAFTMVVAGAGVCAAAGRVSRTQPGGEFIVVLDEVSPAFCAFVSSLVAQ